MDEEPQQSMDTSGTPPAAAAPAKGKGMWIGIVVVVIVIVILLAAVFGGLFGAPTQLPQAVYHVGYPEDAIKYMPTLWANRQQWTASWYFSEGLKEQSFIDDLKGLGIDVTRIEGTAPTTSTDANILQSSTIFNTNYTATFNDPAPGLFAPNGYDGIFLLALAMAKANTTDTTQQTFKDAMRAVSNPPGTTIRPTEWSKALTEIAANRDVDYIGAAGALNLDAAGEPTSDYEVWRVNASGGIERKLFIADGSWAQPAPPMPGTREDTRPPTPTALNMKFGAVLSFTGGLQRFGPDIRNGTNLAIQHINNQGGIWGGTASIVYEDDATTPATGQNAASKLINTDNVDAILGSLASSVSEKVYEVAKPAGVAVMSPASTSPLFTTLDDVDLFWRTAPSDALQGKAAALYAYRDAGWRRVSVFHINNPYGDGLGGVFESDFKSRGGTVLRNVEYDVPRASYDSELGTLFTPTAARAPPAPRREEP